eukprot:CAMPEP_0202829510 /NCGR_PEP_ID=MMETSP1389-20130828/15563_1 /ASSEMBLY_ACC=CAM_ASM_000865 /TAXON_ID=302021 /ORGANISM="Rhodomonas sp., Strain CCMP768" /LENGTH=606 /DNA_ID=CAMNT_0049503071 /DNA_START=36 /DNA_END=1857 /DNA_ORIENTATION=+
MSIFMLAEFTTIGGLFQDFVGSVNSPIIIVVGVLTTAYTAYGGLLVSIVTDQVQATFSLLILLIVTITVAATFRQDLPENFGELEELLGPNTSGYSAIFVMPLSLLSATVFNEGMWQRVWAAENERALKLGGLIACFWIVVAVFLYGLFGFLAAWGGLIDFETANPNLYMFQIFRPGPGEGQATVSQWVHVLVLVLAATMNQSAIDSLMNGITATLSSHFLRREPLIYARFCVVLISIPICVVALENLSVLQIFLTGNMLGACCFMPLIIGGYWDSPLGRRIVSESAYVFSMVSTVLITIVYGAIRRARKDVGTSISEGAEYTWVTQPYEWDYFLVAWGFSWVTLFLFGAVAELLRRNGIEGAGISQLLGHIPGFHALAQDSKEDGPGPIHSWCMACLGRPLDDASSASSVPRAVDLNNMNMDPGPKAQGAMVFMPVPVPGPGHQSFPLAAAHPPGLYPVYQPAPAVMYPPAPVHFSTFPGPPELEMQQQWPGQSFAPAPGMVPSYVLHGAGEPPAVAGGGPAGVKKVNFKLRGDQTTRGSPPLSSLRLLALWQWQWRPGYQKVDVEGVRVWGYFQVGVAADPVSESGLAGIPAVKTSDAVSGKVA